ncbi:hypothetical protein G6N76_16820 [Rhizobium daejeonense]|uniref:Uncharacterized protein n=1 Tax=Rhizobium daejeonense TaxID=240521 RepID=A0A6M1S2N4_9HYPH|nr:hypothetical protein [Rhizobium daejeonense]NGO65335.1 hypothetical protein [Rhizobium daejeonense]
MTKLDGIGSKSLFLPAVKAIGRALVAFLLFSKPPDLDPPDKFTGCASYLWREPQQPNRIAFIPSVENIFAKDPPDPVVD